MIPIVKKMGRYNNSGTLLSAIDVIRTYIDFAGERGIMFGELLEKTHLSKPTIIRGTKRLLQLKEIVAMREGKFTRFKRVVNIAPNSELMAFLFGKKVSDGMLMMHRPSISYSSLLPKPEAPGNEILQVVNGIGAIVTAILFFTLSPSNKFVLMHPRYTKSTAMKNYVLAIWANIALNVITPKLMAMMKDAAIREMLPSDITEEVWNEQRGHLSLHASEERAIRSALQTLYPDIYKSIQESFDNLENLYLKHKRIHELIGKQKRCAHHFMTTPSGHEKICENCKLRKNKNSL